MSELETTLDFHLKAHKAAPFVREFRFHPVRRWRFDFAWPEHQLAAECEGGVWTGGRHTRGKPFVNDCEKYNTATLLGWRVLRFPEGPIKDGSAALMIIEALTQEIPQCSKLPPQTAS